MINWIRDLRDEYYVPIWIFSTSKIKTDATLEKEEHAGGELTLIATGLGGLKKKISNSM
jgi:hypothetical protein